MQEIEKESECAESRKARQRAKRNAKKNEKKVAKRKDVVRPPLSLRAGSLVTAHVICQEHCVKLACSSSPAWPGTGQLFDVACVSVQLNRILSLSWCVCLDMHAAAAFRMSWAGIQGVLDEPGLSAKHEKSLDTCKSGCTDNIQRSSSSTAAGGDSGMHVGAGGEEKDRFGCTMQVWYPIFANICMRSVMLCWIRHISVQQLVYCLLDVDAKCEGVKRVVQEAAELDAFRRVLLEGRVSPEEAVWQWCSDEDDIKPEQLRKMWDFMVDAASQCRLSDKQGTFLNIVSVLLEVCQNHGISVKQGKKVKARLEKVAALRRELEDAMRPPVDETRLEGALDCARGVASLLDDELLDCARGIIDKLQAGGEEAAVLRCATPASDDDTGADMSVSAQGESVCGSIAHAEGITSVDQQSTTGGPTTPNSSRSALETGSRLSHSVADVPPPPLHPSRRVAPSMHADHPAPPAPCAGCPHMPISSGMPSRAASGGLGQPAPPAAGLREMHAHTTNGSASQGPSLHPAAQHMRDIVPKPQMQPTPPAHPPAPAPPGAPPPPNPFSGTQSAMDPMMDLLGQDLVGALDSGGNVAAATRTPAAQSGWKAMNGTGQPSTLPPRQAPMHGQMRAQPPAPSLRPYGGVFRTPAAGGTGTTRPPPGPPPAPPPLTSMVDAYGTPKPPSMQRNGMKMHPSPTQQSGYPSYGPMRTFDPKMDPQSGASHANGFVMPQQRMHGDVLTRPKDSAARFSSLNMRAAPFLPASKTSGTQGGSQQSSSTSGTDVHAQPFLKPTLNGANAYGTSAREDSSFAPSHALPSDPFGLDPGSGHTGGDIHRLRRNATVDAVTSVLGGGVGKGSTSEPTLAAYSSHSHASRDHGAQSHGIEESLLGLDFLDVLDGGNS